MLQARVRKTPRDDLRLRAPHPAGAAGGRARGTRLAFWLNFFDSRPDIETSLSPPWAPTPWAAADTDLDSASRGDDWSRANRSKGRTTHLAKQSSVELARRSCSSACKLTNSRPLASDVLNNCIEPKDSSRKKNTYQDRRWRDGFGLNDTWSDYEERGRKSRRKNPLLYNARSCSTSSCFWNQLSLRPMTTGRTC
jgi:hypothetical protein